MTGAATLIKKCVGGVFTAEGFRREGQTWILETADALLMGNLQKSSYGDGYFLNLAVWLKLLGAIDAKPPINQCHIQWRADSMYSELAAELRELLDAGRELPEADRSQRLKLLLQKEVLPHLVDCGLITTLRAHYKAGRLKGARIFASAITLLDS